MKIIRWLLTVFRCQHSDTYRETRAGVLHLVCHACGHATPLVFGERAKIRRLEKQWRTSRSWRADKPKADVVVMPRRSRKEGA